MTVPELLSLIWYVAGAVTASCSDCLDPRDILLPLKERCIEAHGRRFVPSCDRCKAEKIIMYVSTVIASQNTILHRNSHQIRTEELFYPDERSVESTRILATVGTAPRKWYTQEALMRYNGAAENLGAQVSIIIGKVRLAVLIR
jgi:hypothetical protein